MPSRGFNLVLCLFLGHLAALYLYTRGFLLTRLALSETSSCETPGSCPFPPSYSRAVVLIIDSLRFDFVTPNPPLPPSPYHHNVLRLPAELSAAQPDHSLLLYAFPDPPTTTLQRIKGLTTGSLPTFVDMGSNFGGSSILEDSIIGQLRAAGKRLAFMGDDTWMTVFPDSFSPNMSWPYDSFHVEDLHTVDEGVIRHLFPLLREKTKSWDFILGHFLGVDHVGHRLGPDHPTMKAKLEQMDHVLRSVVQDLDDDTLLIVLGDHGMDTKGDHGGDGALETSAALWLYSKSRRLVNPEVTIPKWYLSYRTYPNAPTPHRSVQQISLVPSLSLLLGIPIPFNNLGTVIPELFWHDKAGSTFYKALQANAAQVKRYLQAYRSSPAGGELDGVWDALQATWEEIVPPHIMGRRKADRKWQFTELALSACREMWAQFNVSLMVLGLALLIWGTFSAWTVYSRLGELQEDWTAWSQRTTKKALVWSAGGSAAGIVVYFMETQFVKVLGLVDCIVFGAAFASSTAILIASTPSTVLKSFNLSSIPLPLILHTLAFMSNSFTFWEDHLTTFLALSSIVPFAMIGITAPTSRLRYRILGFSALFAVCVRLIATSTVCREEQQPYCEVTFSASSAITAPPQLILLVSIPTAIGIPLIVQRFLAISQSDKGLASILLPWILPMSLFQGTLAWMLEWMDSVDIVDPEWSFILRPARTTLAWVSLGTILFFGLSLWYHVTLCVQVKTEAKDGKREITIIGFANLFGASYLMFWLISFSIIYLATQLTGQVVMSLAVVALISFLEVVDSVRDVRRMNIAFSSSNPSKVLDLDAAQANLPLVGLRFSEVTPLALLGVHAFYGTGHQATISSIQWKSAFVLTAKMQYPYSVILVILNTFGPFFLFALATPLLALWNTAPLPHPNASSHARRLGVKAGVGFMLYYSAMLIGSAVSSAWLRRHLMVWKVFAPRFMLAATSLLAVDLAVLLAVGIGMARVEAGLNRLLGATPSMNLNVKT